MRKKPSYIRSETTMPDINIMDNADREIMEEKWIAIAQRIRSEANRNSGLTKEHYGAELVAASAKLLGAGVRELTIDSVIMRATGTYLSDSGYRQMSGWLCFDDAPDCLMYLHYLWLGYIKECHAESDSVTQEIIDILERMLRIALREGSIDNDALLSLIVTGISCLADSFFLDVPIGVSDWSINSIIATHDLGKNGKLKHKELLRLAKADEIDADNPVHLRLLEEWLGESAVLY